MNLAELELEGFTVHEGTRLSFPPRGIVLVTGANGSGKSSIVEGVAYAGWGETLRGTVPGGREARGCSAIATLSAVGEAASLRVSRSRKKDKTSLSWAVNGEKPSEWPTTSKAQEELEARLGTFEMWRRTHVFSSSDAAHFTTATDKERKLFLEMMLGLERFDSALDRCREDLKQAERAHANSEAASRAKALEIEKASQRIADAERTLADLGPEVSEGATRDLIADLEGRARHLREHIKKAEREVAFLLQEISGVSADTGGAERELSILAARLRRLGDAGVCDACGQVVPEELRAGLKEGIEKIKRGVLAAQEKARAASDDFRSEAKDVEDALSKLRSKERALLAELDGHQRSAQARSSAERARKGAHAARAAAARELEDLRAAHSRAEMSASEAARELMILRGAEAALGLRGARVGILSKMLGGLEAAANAWLPRLAGKDIRLELKPYSEKKSGGVSDALAVIVRGAGGGEGYRATSGGERRRTDVALLLAFAGQGTLFFDEVFDALDSEGVQAICEVLGELSRDRCIVVISHNEELASRVPAFARWHVEGGKVVA